MESDARGPAVYPRADAERAQRYKRLHERRQHHRDVHTGDYSRRNLRHLDGIYRENLFGSEQKKREEALAVSVSGRRRTHPSANDQRPQARYDRLRTGNEAAPIDQSRPDLARSNELRLQDCER